MKVHDVLTDETKWMKGFTHHGDRYCLVGALNAVRNNCVTTHAALNEAITALFPGRGSVVDFNDHPETTFEDVLRVCKVADV